MQSLGMVMRYLVGVESMHESVKRGEVHHSVSLVGHQSVL